MLAFFSLLLLWLALKPCIAGCGWLPLVALNLLPILIVMPLELNLQRLTAIGLNLSIPNPTPRLSKVTESNDGGGETSPFDPGCPPSTNDLGSLQLFDLRVGVRCHNVGIEYADCPFSVLV